MTPEQKLARKLRDATSAISGLDRETVQDIIWDICDGNGTATIKLERPASGRQINAVRALLEAGKLAADKSPIEQDRDLGEG